jgi:hypothetical protein
VLLKVLNDAAEKGDSPNVDRYTIYKKEIREREKEEKEGIARA